MKKYLSTEYFKEKWTHEGFQKYFKNTGWMFTGQLLMIISLFINIWMARHLGPTNYGIISYVFAFVGIFSFIANFGINDILTRDLVRHPENKNKLLGTAFRLLSFGGISAFILTTIFAITLENSPLTKVLIILYSTIFIWSPVNVISAYFQATVQAKRNAIAQIIGTLITSSLKIFFIVNDQGVIWLTAAFALDYVMGTLLYIYNYKKSDLDFKKWVFDKTIAKTFLHSSYLLMVSAAAGYILLKIDQVMIKYYLGETAVGLYAAAVKLSEIWYFIPAIICSSLFPAIINAKKTGEIIYKSRLKKLFVFLFSISVIISIPITIASFWITKTLYGMEYVNSASILQIYIWSGVGLFIMTGVNKYFMAENYLKSIFYYNLLAVVTNIILNLILIPQIGLTGAAWATLVSYSVGPIIILIKHKLSNKYEK